MHRRKVSVEEDQATQSGAQSEAQSGAQSDKVLKILANKPFSANELVDKLNLKSKTGAFKRTIRDLLDGCFIEYTIPELPSSRLQKYRLTEKGRKLVVQSGANSENGD